MFIIEMKDKEGTYLLHSNRDCSWVCPVCCMRLELLKDI